MIRFPLARFHLLAGGALLACLGVAAAKVDVASGCLASTGGGLTSTEAQVQELRTASFPELATVNISMHTFHSRADYFRTRFSLTRFLLPARMRYFVEANPALFTQQAPSDGVCGVLAHELSHVVALSRGNRLRRLGLIRLLSKSFTVQFERKTDLEAIHRGYGDGLKSYRTWVYAHIPPDALPSKRRNYFSPEEIDAIRAQLQKRPDLLSVWRKRAPTNLQEVLDGAK